MSLTRPLAARGDRGREREAVLRKTRDEVRQRAGGWCEFTACGARGTDLAHLFRRGNRVGRPLCDHPALCLWACRSHHDALDGRRSLLAGEEGWCVSIERGAAVDAIAAFGLVDWATHDGVILWSVNDTAPIDAVRWLERHLRAEGRIRGQEWVEP